MQPTPTDGRDDIAARLATLAALVLGALLWVSCDQGDRAPAAGPGQLGIEVAPLSIGPVTDVVYRLSVYNGDDQEVWTADVSSVQYGDGAGALSYVGTCDAEANPNRVELAIVSMSDAHGPLADGDGFANPAPLDDPMVRVVECLEHQDVSVTYEFTVSVTARQGFFDIAVSFDDIFCSAKFDCLREGDPLDLLYDPLTGLRDQTAVLGFACTAGQDQNTVLWMDPVDIQCDGGGPFTVNSAGGPGNLNPYYTGADDELLFQAAAYRGVELLGDAASWNKAYWNVAMGLNEGSFATLQNCTAYTLASASNGNHFEFGQTPLNVRWPAI